MSTGKLLLGVLSGVAAGAIIGVLFAPDKGAHTRRKISKTGENYVDSLKDKFNEFMDSMTDKFEQVKEGLSEYADDAKVEVDEMKVKK